MDAAKHDIGTIRLLLCDLRQNQGIASEIRMLDHFVALIVVAKDHHPIAERLLGSTGSFEEFLGIMRTGIDPDQAHPQFGPFLQVMPWPAFQNMTDRDLRAIYEYLSAIPCIEGDPGLPNPRPIGTRCN